MAGVKLIEEEATKKPGLAGFLGVSVNSDHYYMEADTITLLSLATN
jgi:hypothetical protein